MGTFEEFAGAHVGDLLHLARALCDTRQDAEDLTQDALIRLMRKWDQVGRAENPLAYARRVLVNEHHGRHRRKRVRTVSLRAVAETGDRDSSERTESRLWIADALQELAPTQRRVVVLRYYLQLTDREIAAWTGLKESSVRASMSRATTALRTYAEGANLPDTRI